ncbi:uncharacterized protein BO96DRAFT_239433 [Aspergillus niger CBS 101883]|uniref:Uncharacterized protein n=1 Tax=Aspergillus niger ATCC 13496 TaxID=1353008 RepID=A0A370C4E8_ASPNG|nr:uncharacterized protein BO96DRAFT_239433 [Aspergillus niger CBS 101883]PYH58378.1 hypothetical protein BO96DRAFT_239433 [Aspergillus niger CBS 101883]RDH22748.1 hypothetical protein M747DRAFT_171389 [Aspergillus niger ATCC 13496]
MAGLLTGELGWPVGFWSRYSPFGVLFVCLHLSFDAVLFGFLSTLLFFPLLFFPLFFLYFFFCHDLPRPARVGVCIYLQGVYVSGSCFPLIHGGFRCYSIIIRVWLRVWPKHAGFSSATGLLSWV